MKNKPTRVILVGGYVARLAARDPCEVVEACTALVCTVVGRLRRKSPRNRAFLENSMKLSGYHLNL